MYHKILVPLDGSELAECVLPHVEAIVQGSDSCEVMLLHVVEPLHTGGFDDFIDVDAIRDTLVSKAEEYLLKTQSQLARHGWSIRAEVRKGGRPASIIVDFAKENEVDLIVIATHGHSGISRWVYGSVADKVVRSASTPVLLIRPTACEVGI
ncbi:MAG: universal stress protein [Chloroflexi bacterium]|nr:universal stress protein [Chloroflexota bacterium]